MEAAMTHPAPAPKPPRIARARVPPVPRSLHGLHGPCSARAHPRAAWPAQRPPAWAAARLLLALLPAFLLAFAPGPLRAGPLDPQGQPVPARHLGRLFSTPQERALLDARRDGSAIESQPTAGPARPPSPPAPIQLNGVIQRSNGQTTVWLNDALVSERDGKVLPDRSVSLRLPSGKQVTLKPGQSYDQATGSISNAGQ
jgi:hypothetical protein